MASVLSSVGIPSHGLCVTYEDFDPLEPAPEDPPERDRCSNAELAEREGAALQLLAAGTGSALTAATLAERFGVSLRQARRYVRVASFDLLEPLTPAELDCQAAADLYRLDLIAGRAISAGEDGLAIRATSAHARAVAQFRKAVEPAGPQRLRLRTSRTRPELIG